MRTLAPVLASLLLAACDGGGLNVFTLQDDIELGGQLRDEILANPAEYPVASRAEHPEAYADLDRIAYEVLDEGDVAHRDTLDWEFYLIADDDVLNAFAAPGGYVFVYTGIMKFLTTEDAFAGVMGHEIAHAAQRHSTQQLTRAFGISMLLDIALGDGTARDVAELASSLGTLAFSREHETEADEYSVRYLCETLYAADGAAHFFEALGAQPVPEFLSTHPSSERRVEEIEELAVELGCDTSLSTSTDWQAVLDRLP